MANPSDFESVLDVRGEVLHGSYPLLTMSSPSASNALASLLLEIGDLNEVRPHLHAA